MYTSRQYLSTKPEEKPLGMRVCDQYTKYINVHVSYLYKINIDIIICICIYIHIL